MLFALLIGLLPSEATAREGVRPHRDEDSVLLVQRRAEDSLLNANIMRWKVWHN